MDISEDMIKRSMLRAAADETAGRVGGAPSLQNLYLIGDEEYLPLQPKYVLCISSRERLFFLFELFTLTLVSYLRSNLDSMV